MVNIINLDLDFLKDLPEGQVPSLLFLLVSTVFGVIGYYFYDKNEVVGYIFISGMVVFGVISIYTYTRFLPCKVRVSEQSEKHTNHSLTLCPRCTGFYIGIIVFTFSMALLRIYGKPNLSEEAAYILLFLGVLSFLPAAVHGILRRYYKIDLPQELSLVLLYVSGFLTALGGFLVGVALTVVDGFLVGVALIILIGFLVGLILLALLR